MKRLENIRQLYIPVQPTVRQSSDNVLYREFLPHKNLQAFIYCYWELKTTESLEEQFNYRVVADGCIDIFFELHRPTENFVMGFCKKYTAFPLDHFFHYIGVRFLPTMFPQIFKVNASDLSNQFQSLAEVVPKTAEFIANNLGIHLPIDKIKQTFDDYFISVVEETDFDDDSRLYEALDIILKNFGVLNIETDLKTGISPRQLRRIFKYYIGDTAKTFSKVVRFQNILRAKPSQESLRSNKLFYDIGYYDQAHFIKDFKNFYGVTPSQAFGR